MINEGKITVAIDNRKVHNGVTRAIKKASQHTQDAGAEIAQTKNILKTIKFDIEFKFTRMQKNKQCNLQR